MKVSIIVPVYNVSSYVEDCLRSVIEQTYEGELECIIVDDCGTDDSIAKCEAFVESYRGDVRFTLLHHEHNRGLSAARNTGIGAAAGEYVYFLDSDDTLLPKSIELLAAEVAKHPGVELVQGTTKSEPTDDYNSMDSLRHVEYVDEPYWMRLQVFRTENEFQVNAWNKLLKKDFLTENRLYFKEGLIHEDELWMYWVALCVRRIAIVYEDTYRHLKRTSSIMSTSTKEREAQHHGVIMTEILDNLREPHANRAVLKVLRRFLTYYEYTTDESRYNALYEKLLTNLTNYGYNGLATLLRSFVHSDRYGKIIMRRLSVLMINRYLR